MMEHFLVGFRVVLPVILFIGLGYFLKCIDCVSTSTLYGMNKLVFKVFLPVLLFCNMYRTDIGTVVNVRLILFAVVCVLAVFLILCAVIPKIIKNQKQAVTAIQGLYRSNFALFGIALAEAMYGKGNVDVTGMLVAVIVPLYNVLAVSLFEFFGGESGVNVQKVMKGIITNPLIIGTGAGLVFNVADIVICTEVADVLDTVGSLATPIALIVLGGTFSFSRIGENKRNLILISVGRLLLIPMLIVTGGMVLGYRSQELFALYLMAGSPTAVASFSMADAMGGDSELAGQIIVVTSVLSLVSSIGWISVLSIMGMI